MSAPLSRELDSNLALTAGSGQPAPGDAQGLPTATSQAFAGNSAGQNSIQIFGVGGDVRIRGADTPSEKTPHAIYDAPDLLSSNFVGRSTELKQIQDVFDTPLDDVPARCIIWGMPGLGKTQLALKYSLSAFKEKKFSYVFWMSASSAEKVNQGFVKIVDLVCYPGRANMDQAARITAARHWLDAPSDKDTRWLLVLDNAHPDVVAELRDVLPKRNLRGCILMTTRAKPTAEALAVAAGIEHKILELLQPDSDDAIDLLLKGTKQDISDPHMRGNAKEVVQSIGYLPLAVDHAASFMKESGCSIAELLGIYNSEQVGKAMDWENSLSLHEERSITATFMLAFEQLTNTAPAISDLLRILSFLDPESIPIEMLISGAGALPEKEEQSPEPKPQTHLRTHKKLFNKLFSKSPPLAPPIKQTNTFESDPDFSKVMALLRSKIDLLQAIQQLQKLSLAVCKSDQGAQTLWIHDLVHLLLRTKLVLASEKSEWLEQAILITSNAFFLIKDHRAPKNWPQCEKFVAHFQCLSKHAKALGLESRLLLDSNHWVASYFSAAGRHMEEVRLKKEVLEGRKRTLGNEHERTLDSMTNLATAFNAMGLWDEAYQLDLQAVEISTRVLGPEHPSTITYKLNLARRCMDLKLWGEAENTMQKVAELSERIIGPESTSSINSMGLLAQIYSCTGQWEKAEELGKKAFELSKRALGTEHPRTLDIMGTLAGTYNNEGKYDEGAVLGQEVVAIQQRVLGPDHPETLVSMFNLAVSWRNQARDAEALALMKQVYAVRQTKLGPDHPNTRNCAKFIAFWEKPAA